MKKPRLKSVNHKVYIRAGSISTVRNLISKLLIIISIISILIVSYIILQKTIENITAENQFDKLKEEKENNKSTYHYNDKEKKPVKIQNSIKVDNEKSDINKEKSEILKEYQTLYEKNNDLIGWLFIKGTMIDYPVMQTPDKEQYYLHRDFNKKENRNGCLFIDTNSKVGKGAKIEGYINNSKPSTNILVYGHNMKSGLMFGTLKRYLKEEFYKGHNIINFDSLYEKRQYEIISVFLSKVYSKKDKAFKYYNFFQADTTAEFNDYYNHITAMSLYNTGKSAELGDELITLSTCSYQTDNGRLIIVGKRIK